MTTPTTTPAVPAHGVEQPPTGPVIFRSLLPLAVAVGFAFLMWGLQEQVLGNFITVLVTNVGVTMMLALSPFEFLHTRR